MRNVDIGQSIKSEEGNHHKSCHTSPLNVKHGDLKSSDHCASLIYKIFWKHRLYSGSEAIRNCSGSRRCLEYST